VFVSSKQAASVDAKVWGVTFSPSSVPLVWHHKYIYKLIIIQVNKLQVMKPSTQVWHHTPGTPRGRMSSSHAFRSVTFAYDESICWQTTRLFAAQNVV
jgi:hypothetical protein